MWLIIGLILIGVLLLVAELILLPGISVAGIGALIAFIAVIIYSYVYYGFLIGSLVLTVIIILSIIAVVVSLRANTWRRLSLKSTIDSTSVKTPQEHNIEIGARGTTLTRLAPMGKVQIGDVTIEAKSVDKYVDPHKSVEVIGYDNTVVIVKVIK